MPTPDMKVASAENEAWTGYDFEICSVSDNCLASEGKTDRAHTHSTYL